jgi:hypothetical protein
MKEQGGPAFPTRDNELGYYGMTLRDYFAAKVLQAHLGNVSIQNAMQKKKISPQQLATGAYHWADAMLEARKYD